MRTMRSEAAENNLLVKSGFIKSERSTLSSKLAIDAPGYTIPVMFNPFYRDGNALINDATFDDESAWPLYRTIVESQSRHLGLTNVGCLKDCERIKLATGPQARSNLGRLVPVFTRPTEAKWLYMVIEDRGGASQLELANELINALTGCYMPRFCLIQAMRQRRIPVATLSRYFIRGLPSLGAGKALESVREQQEGTQEQARQNSHLSERKFRESPRLFCTDVTALSAAPP